MAAVCKLDHTTPTLVPKPERSFVHGIRGIWIQLALSFAIGACLASTIAVAACRGWGGSPAQPETIIDFHFQMLNISSPRQDDKLLNVFVKWRYPQDSGHCPFSPTDNTCIQYQHFPRALILNVTQGIEGPELGAEWERVVLFICRNIFANYDITALSVLLQVNGDGRSWVKAYEPGAHGSTCTIGPPEFSPIERSNNLPDFVDGDVGPGKPKPVGR